MHLGLKEVCLSIWSIMRPKCISKPTKGQWELTALEFEKKTANFPRFLEAVDGKHFRVIKRNTVARCSIITKFFYPWYYWPWQTLNTALCTLTMVVTEKTVVLQFLNDLRYGHQFRQICWNYTMRELFQEENVQMYHTSL